MPHDKDQMHWHEPSGSKKAGSPLEGLTSMKPPREAVLANGVIWRSQAWFRPE